MIKYHFSAPNPANQFVKIVLSFQNSYPTKVKLQLPAWRAGRYQIADFAKNIKNLIVLDQSGQTVPFKKEAKNLWIFNIESSVDYQITYEYYAAKMDAGSSWLDEEQWYLNLVNCCFEVLGITHFRKYSLEFAKSNFPKRVCTLPQNEDGFYIAKDFQVLADTTFLAAQKLTHWSYSIGGTKFNLWFHGEIHFDKKTFIQVFKNFSKRMIQDFGDFPEREYHFIFQLLPYTHYHGVEHQKGTVITFGPADSLQKEAAMENLLGVSCHELYHAWNVCRIRPKELLPYDFGREVFTNAGWVLEGITTYLGDLYLLKSGVYSLETYLNHLNRMVKREGVAQGTQSISILDSSLDLWLDGYEQGIPSKKTNIYSHGALIAMALDIHLLECGASLPELMKTAWLRFGKNNRGYTQKSFWRIINSMVPNPEALNEFQERYISGTGNILEFLQTKLPKIGLKAIPNPDQPSITFHLGIHLKEDHISFVHPDSPAYDLVMAQDKVSLIHSGLFFKLDLERVNGRRYQYTIEANPKRSFPELLISGQAETELGLKWGK